MSENAATPSANEGGRQTDDDRTVLSTVPHRGNFPEVLRAALAEFDGTTAVTVALPCPPEKLDWAPLAALDPDTPATLELTAVTIGAHGPLGDPAAASVEGVIFTAYLGHIERPRWVTDYLGVAPDGQEPEKDPVAEAYAGRGWLDVFPLPAGQKAPPPVGLTGGVGMWTDDQRAALAFAKGGNYGLRAPAGVIAIDVDHYTKGATEKSGARTIAELEAKLGALPPTWRTSSRGADNPSGQRWFRVPALRHYESSAGRDVEVIHRHHRYAVIPPSNHPEGGRYSWIAPDGTLTTEIPLSPRLPELPAAWADYLTTTREPVGGATPAGIAKATRKLSDLYRDSTSAEPVHGFANDRTRAFISHIPGKFDRGTSRYDSMVGLFWEAAKRSQEVDHRNGQTETHGGMWTALEAIADEYRRRVGTDRPSGIVEGEIHRAMVGAFAKVQG